MVRVRMVAANTNPNVLFADGARRVPRTGGLSLPHRLERTPGCGRRAVKSSVDRRPRTSPRDELITPLFSAWLLSGLFIDGWAHSNLPTLETFFTPWHAALYSGFLATAMWTAWLV